MGTFTATAVRIGSTLEHEVNVNGRHTLVTDEPPELGGSDLGPAPHELLPAAVAACASTMIALYAQRKGWEIGEVRCDVVYDSEAVPRRLEVTVCLPDGLSENQRVRLQRVAATCPVVRALEAGFTVEEHFTSPVLAA